MKREEGKKPLERVAGPWLSGWSAGCEPKGRGFDSQSGHMPGLRARTPVGGCKRQPHTDISLFLLLFPSLKINKISIKSLKS